MLCVVVMDDWAVLVGGTEEVMSVNEGPEDEVKLVSANVELCVVVGSEEVL